MTTDAPHCGSRAAEWRPRLMRRHPLLLKVLSCFFLFLATDGSAVEQWKLAKEGDSVKIYTRPIEGSSVNELKGEMRAKTSLSAILALIDDLDSNRKWVPKSGGVTILKRISPQEVYVRGIILSPWPFYDRDTVVRFFLDQAPDTLAVTIEMEGVAGYYPTQENYLRVPSLKGFWKFTPQAKGMVRIEYQIYADPGGLVPAWLMNPFSVDNVYGMLRNMREVLKNKKYRSATAPYIKEP